LLVVLLPHPSADDFKKNFFLVEQEINEYMTRFDVRFSPGFSTVLEILEGGFVARDLCFQQVTY